MPVETTVNPEEQAGIQNAYYTGFHDAMEQVAPIQSDGGVRARHIDSVNVHIHRWRGTLHRAGENARMGAAAALDLGQTDQQNGRHIAAI